jgi:hypothetical protein
MKAIKYFVLSILLLSSLGQLLAQTCLSNPPLKNLKATEDSWCLEANGYYVHTLKFTPAGERRISYILDVAENEVEEDDLIPLKRFDAGNSMTAVFFALILVYSLHHLKKRLAFHRQFSFFRSYSRYLIFQVIKI